ncbi:MAG: hypothetical protein JRF53_16785 [Deltaproteobacteria bacterium]|nr:hypothetical protein [Deltaproteobacteria bacterium]
MMSKNKEVRLAFELWIKVCQLESELWHKYDEDFMNLMMNKEDDNLTDDPLDPKDDVFPF